MVGSQGMVGPACSAGSAGDHRLVKGLGLVWGLVVDSVVGLDAELLELPPDDLQWLHKRGLHQKMSAEQECRAPVDALRAVLHDDHKYPAIVGAV